MWPGALSIRTSMVVLYHRSRSVICSVTRMKNLTEKDVSNVKGKNE